MIERALARLAARAVLAATILGCQGGSPDDGSAPARGEPWTAIVGVHVVAMDSSRLLRERTVLIRGERIEAIGAKAEIELPAGTRVVEGAGRYLLPGLVDAHVHLREADTTALADYLAAGVTTARDMNGRPFLLEWRDRIAAGELRGPTLVVASPTLANWSSPAAGYPTPETEEEGRAAVRRFHAEGYDLVKVYSFLPAAAFRGVVEEARSLGMPVAGHVPVEPGLLEALGGMTSVEHLTEYVGESLTAEAAALDEEDFRSVFHAGEIDTARLRPLIDSTVAAGVWNVPTIVWFDRNLPAPMAEAAWSQPELREQGERNRRMLVGMLSEAGAPLAVGTDSDAGEHLPAEAIHDELIAMREAGLSPFEALRAATVAGATLLGLDDEIGTVEAGKRADLLLMACNPLEDLRCLRRPEAVIARGRVVAEGAVR